MTDIRLLGPLEVFAGSGERMRIGSTRDQKVLAALALAGGRLVALDHLVAVAWDVDPPSTARHQVQKSIASLRAVLGSSVIITDGAAYRVVADTDVAAFEDRVRAAAALEPSQAAPELRAALELWRGSALAGLVSSELGVDADRWNERRISVTEQCCALELALGRPPESAALIGRMLGPARALAEPEAVASLARLCGHLPLALRVAAANLAASRDRVADAVAALEGDDRLSLLSIRGDQRGVVSAAFDLSYRELAAGPARLFRLLWLLPRNDFTVHAAAALLGETLATAGSCVAALEIANLVESFGRTVLVGQ